MKMAGFPVWWCFWKRIPRQENKEFLRLDCDVDSEFLNRYYGSQGFELAGNCEDGMYKGNRRQKKLRG